MVTLGGRKLGIGWTLHKSFVDCRANHLLQIQCEQTVLVVATALLAE